MNHSLKWLELRRSVYGSRPDCAAYCVCKGQNQMVAETCLWSWNKKVRFWSLCGPVSFSVKQTAGSLCCLPSCSELDGPLTICVAFQALSLWNIALVVPPVQISKHGPHDPAPHGWEDCSCPAVCSGPWGPLKNAPFTDSQVLHSYLLPVSFPLWVAWGLQRTSDCFETLIRQQRMWAALVAVLHCYTRVWNVELSEISTVRIRGPGIGILVLALPACRWCHAVTSASTTSGFIPILHVILEISNLPSILFLNLLTTPILFHVPTISKHSVCSILTLISNCVFSNVLLF